MSSKLSSYLLDGSSRMFEFLEPRAVSRLLDEHRAGRHDHHKVLFSLVVLEEWLRAQSTIGISRQSAALADHETDVALTQG